MKIPMLSMESCVFISCKGKPYEMNGSKGISYKLNLEGPDEEGGELKCSEEVYDLCQQIPKYSKVDVLGEYDCKNNKLSIMSIRLSENKEDKNNVKSGVEKK